MWLFPEYNGIIYEKGNELRQVAYYESKFSLDPNECIIYITAHNVNRS